MYLSPIRLSTLEKHSRPHTYHSYSTKEKNKARPAGNLGLRLTFANKLNFRMTD